MSMTPFPAPGAAKDPGDFVVRREGHAPISLNELFDEWKAEFAAIPKDPRFQEMRWFLGMLFKDYDPTGYIQFKVLDLQGNGFGHVKWWRLDEFAVKKDRDHRMRAVFSQLRGDNETGRDAYVGVLPRDIQKGDASAITRARWMWADLDFKVMKEDALIERALQAGPDILVHTGGGLHWYKKLPAEMDLREERKKFVAACAYIQRTILPGGDNTSDTVRVLRVPGTRNVKRGADVRIIYPSPEKGTRS